MVAAVMLLLKTRPQEIGSKKLLEKPVTETIKRQQANSSVSEKGFGKLPLPNFDGQIFKNLTLDKNRVRNLVSLTNYKNLNTLDARSLLKFLLRGAQAYEDTASESANNTDPKVMAVYAVKRDYLEATAAVELTEKFPGFGKEPKTEIINEVPLYYRVAEGTFVPGANNDLLEVSFVDDPNGLFNGNPYRRSTLGLHKEDGFTADQEGATASAEKFLDEYGLRPPGIIRTEVLTRQDVGMTHRYLGGFEKLVYIRRFIDEMPVIDGSFNLWPEESRLGLALDKRNRVIGLSYDEFLTQIDYERKSLYPIIDRASAYEKLLSGKTISGMIKANTNLPKDLQFYHELDWQKNRLESLDIISVSLAYYRNENVTDSPAGDYYLPIYVFAGRGRVFGPDLPEGSVETELRFFVPALSYE
ncbi:MAG: hypothetical protein AAB486_04965 [Patescibacteria group bacterium]